MRMSKLFFQTLREVPADADTISHQLMLRAGLIHQIAAGIFDYLPLALRTKHKIEDIFREEMNAIDGQEVTLPVVHPAELWQKTGRWQAIGGDMARLKDRAGRDMCLAMTHEEVMADLAKQFIRSYRQLPAMLYQIQTKFRDEPRPRAGLIRVREFTMKDAYTFDRDFAGLDAYYPRFYQAYFNIFNRCDLDVVAVKSDTGMMGGKVAHEYHGHHPHRRGHAGDLRRVRLQRQSPGRHLPQARAADRRAQANSRGRHAPCDHHRRAGPVPGHPRKRNGQGHLPDGRDRTARWRSETAVCLRRRARGYGAERDQADQCHQSAAAAPGPGGGDSGHRRGAGLWLAHRHSPGAGAAGGG